jgi:hypothetical protein
VDPQKSKIWFSKATDQQKQQLIMHIFQAPRATQNEMYLGVPLLATRHQHFDQLMNKIITRLNGWKASMLSHTGKVFLIKSVVEAIASYTMSTIMLPVKVLN